MKSTQFLYIVLHLQWLKLIAWVFVLKTDFCIKLQRNTFFFLAAIIYWQKPMVCHIITLSNRGSKDFEPALETSNVIKYFLFDLLKQKNLSNLNRAQMGFFVWPYWYYWYETRNIEWGSKEKRIERKQDFYLFIFC